MISDLALIGRDVRALSIRFSNAFRGLSNNVYLSLSALIVQSSPAENLIVFRRHGKLLRGSAPGAVAELVGNEGGVVSGVINLESSGVEAPDWRPRHDEH
jgi:hypothetical protein